jgi:Ca2+/Na+ antiporter
MIKALAIIQILFILFLVGYSTYQLFQGRLDLSLSVFPLLMGYYVFVTLRNKRKASSDQASKQE